MHYFLTHIFICWLTFLFILQNLPETLRAESQLGTCLAAELLYLRTRAKASSGTTARQTTSAAASHSALLSTSMCFIFFVVWGLMLYALCLYICNYVCLIRLLLINIFLYSSFYINPFINSNFFLLFFFSCFFSSFFPYFFSFSLSAEVAWICFYYAAYSQWFRCVCAASAGGLLCRLFCRPAQRASLFFFCILLSVVSVFCHVQCRRHTHTLTTEAAAVLAALAGEQTLRTRTTLAETQQRLSTETQRDTHNSSGWERGAHAYIHTHIPWWSTHRRASHAAETRTRHPARDKSTHSTHRETQSMQTLHTHTHTGYLHTPHSHKTI